MRQSMYIKLSKVVTSYATIELPDVQDEDDADTIAQILIRQLDSGEDTTINDEPVDIQFEEDDTKLEHDETWSE